MSPSPKTDHVSPRGGGAKRSSTTPYRSAKSRGRPPGDTTEATKTELLHCAREVFAEYGYHGATIAEIVRRAGVSTPVLYHHFGSKSGLFRAAINDISETLLEARGLTLERPGTLRTKIDALLQAAIDIHNSDPGLARFLLSARVEAARDPELVAMTELAKYSSANIEVFRSLAAGSGLSPERADAVSHVCGTIFGGLSIIAFSSPLDYDTAVKSLRLLLDSDLFDS